ncbi:MAG: rhomboid family intramembrane serine protease [Bacteroidales bacterium]|nr:rhomboid family intramembrane serine protease [Bacteroidales bacterium]
MTIAIIIISAVISVLAFTNSDIFYKLRFNPYIIRRKNEWYRFFSYGLIHADWIHLFINMFVLLSFGRFVESFFTQLFGARGWFYFILLYIGALAISVVASYGKQKDNPYYNAVGASGAVSAVVFASIIFNPLAPIYLFLIPFGIPAVIFGGLYLIYSAYMARRGSDNVGHDAHFWGAVFGILFTIALKPALVGHFFNQLLQGF